MGSNLMQQKRWITIHHFPSQQRCHCRFIFSLTIVCKEILEIIFYIDSTWLYRFGCSFRDPPAERYFRCCIHLSHHLQVAYITRQVYEVIRTTSPKSLQPNSFLFLFFVLSIGALTQFQGLFNRAVQPSSGEYILYRDEAPSGASGQYGSMWRTLSRIRLL